jgi:hypothetical protein
MEHVLKFVRKTVIERCPCHGFCLQDLFVNSLLHLILSRKRNLIGTYMAFQILNRNACIQWLVFLL